VRQAQAIRTALLGAPVARLRPRPAGLGVEPLALRRAGPTDLREQLVLLAPGPVLRARDRLVEHLHDLVQHLDRAFGQQHRNLLSSFVARLPNPANRRRRASGNAHRSSRHRGRAGSAAHVHLDVLVDGKPVQVPAGLGIAASGNEMAELHIRVTTGVLHIKAPTTSKRYVLGQLFTEWNVRLDATNVG
jgi:hypothetical protein